MTEHNGQQERQHLTITQLSTLLDGQLSTEEREFSDAHLASCERCQQELERLRLTVTLLRALPRPALPRSFTLPISTQQTPRTIATRSTVPTTPLAIHNVSSRRSAARRSYVRTAIRTVAALAALIGLVLLLSSLIPFINGSGSETASGTTGSATGATGSTVPATQQVTPGGPFSPNSRATTVTQPNKQPQTTYAPHASTTGVSLPPILDISTLAGRAFYGFLFLLLGIVGLIVGRRRVPHRGP